MTTVKNSDFHRYFMKALKTGEANAFVKVKTEKIWGPALDWAVAQALGPAVKAFNIREVSAVKVPRLWNEDFPYGYSPSMIWEHGGPLIDAFNIWLSAPTNDPDPTQPHGWDAEIYDADGNEVIGHAIGCPTALIAICRAVVLAKLGKKVRIPKELLDGC